MLRSRSFGAKAGGDHLEVAESLSALERARLFATSKLCLQRLVFVHELVECAHEVGYDATAGHLLPLVRQLADDSEVLVRQMLVGKFGDLAGFLIQADPDQGYELVVKVLLPIVSVLLAEKHADVRQGAAEAFVTLAKHLRTGDRGDSVLRCVIALSHGNDDEEARSTAVQLLNALAETLGKPLCEQFIGIELAALAEDPMLRVRKATACNFWEVCKVVDDTWMLRKLFPAFQRLARDAHWSVRKAVVESLIEVAMSVDVEHRAATFVPLMNELLKDQSRWVRIAALQQLGYLIAALERPEPEPRGLLQQYVQIVEEMKANPDVADICYHCAFTFAAVTKASGKSAWRSHLHEPFVSLSRDMQTKARKAIAASVHVVMEVIGLELSETDVSPVFEELLQDPAEEVRLAALRNVPAILRLAPGASPQRRILKIVGSMHEKSKAANWRMRHLLAKLLSEICEELASSGSSALKKPDPGTVHPPAEAEDSDAGGAANPVEPPSEDAAKEQKPPGSMPTPAHIEDLAWSVIVPLFMKLCSDTVAEVRQTAASATACVLRVVAPQLFEEVSTGNDCDGSSGGSASEATHSALVPDVLRFLFNLRTFAKSRQFSHRQVFIRMCDAVVREAPPCCRVDVIFRPLAALAADKVRNVRLVWASTMLPHVRTVGRCGQSRLIVEAAARLLQEDKQVEVQRLLAGAEMSDPSTLEASPDGSEEALEEACNANGWFAREGGTGDVGLTDPRAEVSKDDEELVKAALASVDEEVPSAATKDPQDTWAAIRKTQASSSTSPPGPIAIPAPAEGPPSPGSPLLPAASAPHDHDLVEDSLVEQSEVERDMTAAYIDHMLSGPPPKSLVSNPDEDLSVIEADTRCTRALEAEEEGQAQRLEPEEARNTSGEAPAQPTMFDISDGDDAEDGEETPEETASCSQSPPEDTLPGHAEAIPEVVLQTQEMDNEDNKEDRNPPVRETLASSSTAPVPQDPVPDASEQQSSQADVSDEVAPLETLDATAPVAATEDPEAVSLETRTSVEEMAPIAQVYPTAAEPELTAAEEQVPASESAIEELAPREETEVAAVDSSPDAALVGAEGVPLREMELREMKLIDLLD